MPNQLESRYVASLIRTPLVAATVLFVKSVPLALLVTVLLHPAGVSSHVSSVSARRVKSKHLLVTLVITLAVLVVKAVCLALLLALVLVVLRAFCGVSGLV